MLLAGAAGRAGPDKAVTLAVFVIEEVGVDGAVEAWIIQLEAQIFTAFV